MNTELFLQNLTNVKCNSLISKCNTDQTCFNKIKFRNSVLFNKKIYSFSISAIKTNIILSPQYSN